MQKPRFRIHWNYKLPRYRYIPKSCYHLGYSVDLEPKNLAADELVDNEWAKYHHYLDYNS